MNFFRFFRDLYGKLIREENNDMGKEMLMMRILLIEDDRDLCSAMCLSLEQAGYQVETGHTGIDGLLYASSQAYDVVILDRMLPEMDGMTVLEAMRKRGIHTPVILATALDGLHDRIDGLDAGADDYIVKPFAIEELMARIRAVTRRPGQRIPASRLAFASMELDSDKHELTFQDMTLTLSKKECALLAYFMRNAEQTLPRLLILSYIWGSDSEVEDGNLDNYIYFLRRRLKQLGAPVKLTTVHGVGYRLEESHV